MILRQPSRTAVLIFAASGKKDASRKGIKGSDTLFDTLTDHTVSLVRETGLPFYIHTEKEQIGCDFGSRFHNSIQQIFELGYNNVITVGNDTPHLTITHFNETINHLKKGITTIGPSQDGGFYLLGISKSAFAKAEQSKINRLSFVDLPWQTAGLTKAFLTSLDQEEITHITLEKLVDLDSTIDIKSVLQQSLSLDTIILQLLLMLIESDKSIAFYKNIFNPSGNNSFYYNKGSPCC